jgi:AbiV family abortive infection protein
MRSIKNLRKKMELETFCINNAKNLLKESERMLKRKKYALATFFAITSLEESQKLGLLNMYGAGHITDKKFNEYWAQHVTKYRVPEARMRVVIDNKTNPEMKLILGSKEEAKKILDDRNNCLYVDFSENTIISPQKIKVTTAIDYINRANKELQSAIMLKTLAKNVRKHLRSS